MTFAITIGAYRLVDFIELNIKRCRTIFGADVPILVDDDVSPESSKIAAIAEKHGCGYICSPERRGHFAGDIQTFINSIVFCRQIEADIALKISQRVIPVLPAFKECIEKAFVNPEIMVALPGRPNKNQIARPMARFYNAFGILTDVVAIRNGAMTPEDLMETYRTRFTTGTNHADSLVETTWGWLLANKFPQAHVILPELTNHEPFKPKIYLRKSQALERDYEQVAEMEGVTGQWNVAEWGAIEGKDYLCRPVKV